MDKSRRHNKQAGLGVGGRLRQRLAQMLLHTSCAATTSATAFVGLASTSTTKAAPAASRHEPPPPPARPRSAHSHAHEPRSSSRAVVVDGGSNSSCQRRRRHHQQRRDARALVHISIDCSTRSSVTAAAAVLQPSVPVALRSKQGKDGGRTRLSRAPSYGYGWSWSSSSASDTHEAEGEEQEDAHAVTARSSTLFSSRSLSFSSDSDSDSDLYGTTNNHGGGTRPRRRKKKPPPPPSLRRAPSKARPPADAFWPPAGKLRGNKEERKPGDGSWGAGKAVAAATPAGSTAVVKRSCNPYADFRSSMAEMVAGRRIRGADALSELLVWYLSLNSPRHHPAILAAFEDVWEAVIGSES